MNEKFGGPAQRTVFAQDFQVILMHAKLDEPLT